MSLAGLRKLVGDITKMLQKATSSAPDLGPVFERLYPELKVLARSRLAGLQAGKTLTPTVLVNETYVKLVEARHLQLNDRRHFFACAARAMRHIVVDYVRSAAAQKRGGDQVSVTFSEDLPAVFADRELLDLDLALDELEQISPELLELVELRYFSGLTLEEIASLRQVSVRTTKRQWQRARAFLHVRLDEISSAT